MRTNNTNDTELFFSGLALRSSNVCINCSCSQTAINQLWHAGSLVRKDLNSVRLRAAAGGAGWEGPSGGRVRAQNAVASSSSYPERGSQCGLFPSVPNKSAP